MVISNNLERASVDKWSSHRHARLYRKDKGRAQSLDIWTKTPGPTRPTLLR